MTRPSALTVAVAAHKGGVGKTTTAMALAAGLVRFLGDTVLLVDLDPQGHSTMGLGFDVEEARERTVRELFVEEAEPLGKVTYPTGLNGLHLVPASIRLERAAQWLYARPRRELVLRRALEATVAHRQFDWIVLDCPPSLGPLVENALTAADHVIVPCRMEARAADGLVDLLEVLEQLRPGFDQWRVLRTQRDLRASVTNAAIDAALAPWQGRLLHTVIPKSEALNQAQIARVDVFAYDPSSAGARGYEMLCGEVKGWAEASAPI